MNNQPIKIAHDWMGPYYYYLNNQPFTINSPLSKLKGSDLSKMYLEQLDGYTVYPSYLLSEHDVFIYEFELSYRDESWFNNPDSDLIATSSMSMMTFNKIRGRNGFILINICQEAILEERLITYLHKYFATKGIPLNKVILMAGNPGLHKFYDEICIKQGVLPEAKMHICTIEYFEYLVSKLMENNKEKEEPKNLNFDKIEKTFLCFNRNHRSHRNDMLMLFQHARLLDFSYYSMPAVCPSQGTTWRKNLTSNCMKIHKVAESDVIEVENKLPLVLDVEGDDIHDPGKLSIVWGDNQHYYNHSLISLVTETNYKEPYYGGEPFNTEKVFKPISYRHPFILVGPARSLEYLRSMGYKTFAELWDESYDFIEDPDERMIALIHLCVDINNKTPEEKKRLFYKTLPIVEHNYKLLKSIYSDPNKRRNFLHEFRDAWIWRGGINPK